MGRGALAQPHLQKFVRSFGLLLPVISLLLLAGCVHGRAPVDAHSERAPLRIYGMHQTIELAPVHYTAERIYPRDTLVRNGGIPNLFATDDTRADIATHAETQALRNSLQHPDLRIILTVARGHYRMVARRSHGIATLADLRGKRIATMRSTSAAFHLHNLLRSAGLSEADVTIVPFNTPRDISRSIISGEADALAIWEPEMQIAINALGDDAIEFQPDVGYDELFNLNTTAEALADPARRAQIVRFVAALMQGSRHVTARPEDGIALVARTTGYPLELVRQAWPHHVFPGAIAPDLLDTLEREEIWMAQLTGRPARDRAALASIIDESVAEEARMLLAHRQ